MISLSDVCALVAAHRYSTAKYCEHCWFNIFAMGQLPPELEFYVNDRCLVGLQAEASALIRRINLLLEDLDRTRRQTNRLPSDLAEVLVRRLDLEMQTLLVV
jgi:hypothetical protein